MKRLSNLSTNQKITYVAVLSALGFILNFIEIPYPLVPYLKFDISEVVILVASLISLPAALIVAFMKALLLFLFKGSELIGLSALLLGSVTIATSYSILRPKFVKTAELNVKGEVKTLILTSLIFTFVMLVANFFFVTPMYSNMSVSEMIASSGSLGAYAFYIFNTYFLFNLIKSFLISVIYILLLKGLNRNENLDIELEDL